MNNGKVVGGILIGVGVVVFLIVTVLMVSGLGAELTVSGLILGIGLLGVLPLLLLGGAGLYLFRRGQSEAADMAQVQKQQRLLGMIQAQGKVSMSTLTLESKMTRDEAKTAIYDLVNLGLFSGYIDWQSQTFYSQDAARVGSNKCPNCGGVREIVGKGVVKCPYCGVELFIPPDAPQTVAAPAPPATAEQGQPTAS